MLSAYPKGAAGAAMLQAEPIDDRYKVERNKRNAQRSVDRKRRIRKDAADKRAKAV